MKKILFSLAAVCLLLLTSCGKEKSYSITLQDELGDISSSKITVFEYNALDMLNDRFVINDISGTKVYTSDKSTTRIVLGVYLKNKYYAIYGDDVFYTEPFDLSEKRATEIVVKWGMDGYEENPIDPYDEML